MAIYQILYQNRIETCFEQTTPEESTDVTYENHEIPEYFGVSDIPFSWSSYINTDTMYVMGTSGSQLSVINLPQLMTEINRQLDKSKQAVIELSNNIELSNLNKKYFKPQGFTYKPSKDVFVKFKSPKRKVIVRKSIMSDLRKLTTNIIEKYVRDKYKFCIKFKSVDNIKHQGDVVRFGQANGMTLNSILERTGPFYHGRGLTIAAFIQQALERVNEPEMYQTTMDEYIKWYKECLEGKDCPVENE